MQLAMVSQIVDGSCCSFPQQGLEFREGHLDGVEVGAVGRQEQQPCPRRLDGLADTADLVRWKVVHHHHITGP